VSPLFVVVTRFVKADDSVIVHTYGPYPDRSAAHRVKRQITAEHTGVPLSVHTCKVIDIDAMNSIQEPG
jgi:hypothetical protein